MSHPLVNCLKEIDWLHTEWAKSKNRIEALETALRKADTACFMLCTNHGFATGHGDTVADMIGEIDAQISTRIGRLEASLAEWRALAIQWAKDNEATPEPEK